VTPLMHDTAIFNENRRDTVNTGARGGVVVKALLYKPVGRGFDSRWCHCNFSLT
jgi:hypothetical protein